MPRRTLTPATPAPPPPPAVLPKDPAQLDLSDPDWAANLRLLRRHWKWAAFSQFFYTFAPLLAMDDLSLNVRPLPALVHFRGSPRISPFH